MCRSRSCATDGDDRPVRAGAMTFPQIFIGDRHVGGFTDLAQP